MKIAYLDVEGLRSPGRTRTAVTPVVHARIAELVRAADRGDQAAWDELVDRFTPMLWAVARSTGLNAADAGDVCQTTWLRLLENLGGIEQPERVGGWLATTVRREAIRTSQRAKRTVPAGETKLFDAIPTEAPEARPGAQLLVELDAAIAELPERSRTLIALLLADPPLSYVEISETLGMPIGSIGPTRARILATIRASLERRGISGADVASE